MWGGFGKLAVRRQLTVEKEKASQLPVGLS